MDPSKRKDSYVRFTYDSVFQYILQFRRYPTHKAVLDWQPCIFIRSLYILASFQICLLCCLETFFLRLVTWQR